jgi:tripartite-type tricarboxylate transporter receptor subunit TctC
MKRSTFMKRCALVACAGAAIGLATSTTSTSAGDFPSGNIRLVVNVAAGGLTDSLARILGEGLRDAWSRPVIVENRVGANSTLAAQAVMRAPADGHTLLVTADAPFTATPFMVKGLDFSLSDFAPIAPICRAVPVLAVNPSLGIKMLADFLALARMRSKPLSYGSMGTGTYGHLGMEDFTRRAGIKMVHIPYRGGAPALEGLIRGDVDAMIVNYANIAPFAQAGTATILAAAGDRRTDLLPDLPTISASGVPGFSVSTWFGVFGPAKTPPDLIARIRADVSGVLATDKPAKFLKDNSCTPINATPQQFLDLITSDARHWQGVIEAVGIQPE